ncbi:cadg domain containing protein [Stylonychia lemnae]|uniref:Cadg domain containing protein n=1 Tax=Stylonychia lemnae TaxID=5949 RepID=A0A078B655_STYLE|nr:cadg domain containing protein [Stylonychia lemnae]|eukprot:CDW88792.1 cadg domain containing protein [Stylonychia lemnae]
MLAFMAIFLLFFIERIFGGLTGHTTIFSLDVEYNLRVAVSGYTTSSDLITAGQGHFIAYLGTNNKFKWGKYIENLDPAASACYVRLSRWLSSSESNSKSGLGVACQINDGILVMFMNLNDGEIQSQYYDQTAGTTNRYGLYFHSTDSLFVVLEYQNNWRLTKYMNSTGISFNLAGNSISQYSKASRIILDYYESNVILIGGLIKYTDDVVYTVVSKIYYNQQSINSIQGVANPNYPSEYYTVSGICASDYFSFAVLTDQNAGQHQFTLWITTGSQAISYSRFKTFQEFEVVGCGFGTVLIQYTLSKLLYYIKVDFTNDGNIAYQSNATYFDNYQQRQIVQGSFPKKNYFFYAGSSQSYKYPIPESTSYANQMGFIMGIGSGIQCSGSQSDVTGLLQNFVMEQFVLPKVTLSNSIIQSLTILDQVVEGTVSVTSIDMNSTVDNTWCPQLRTYQSLIYYTQEYEASYTYLLNEPLKNWTLYHTPRVEYACDDAEQKYYVTSPVTLPTFLTQEEDNKGSFKFFTNDKNDLGQYNLTIRVQYEPTKINKTMKIQLSVRHCEDVKIYKSTQYAYPYTVGDGNRTIQLYQFYLTLNCNVTYTLKYKNGSDFDKSIFYFDTVNFRLYLKADNNSQSGIYQFDLYGFVDTFPQANENSSFSITVNYNCFYAKFNIQPQLDVYYYDVSDGKNETIGIMNWSQDLPDCPGIQYTLVDQDFNAPDPAIFSFINKRFTVMSNDFSLTDNEYTFYLIGNNTKKSQAFAFKVVMINSCQVATITPNKISDQFYTIGAIQKQIAVYGWISSTNICKTFTYEVQCSPACNSFLTFDDVNNVINVQTGNLLLTETYYKVTITGYIDFKFQKNTTFFTIGLLNYCQSAVIQVGKQRDLFYTIGSLEYEVELPPFSSTATVAECGAFKYTITEANFKDISFLTLDGDSNILTIFTENRAFADYNPFSLVVSGVQGLSQNFKNQMIFRLNLIAKCQPTQINGPSPKTLIYYILDDPLEVVPEAFSSDPAGCEFTYICKMQGEDCDTTMIKNFDWQTGSFDVFVSDYKKVGMHEVEILAYTGAVSGSTIITLDLQINCNLSVISPVAISNKTLGYKGPNLRFQFTKFSDSLNCGPKIVYTAKQVGQSSLPQGEVISEILSDYRIIAFQSMNFTEEKIISIELIGTFLENSFLITEKLKSMDVSPFSQKPFCDIPINYISTMANGQPLPSFISINTISLTYTISTTNTSHIGLYEIKLSGTTVRQLQSAEIIFTINIARDQSQMGGLINTGPPYFQKDLELFEMRWNEFKLYSLPSIRDDDDDDDYSCELQSSPSFVKYLNGKIYLSSTKQNIGEHQATILLKDKNMNSQSQTYSLKIQIYDIIANDNGDGVDDLSGEEIIVPIVEDGEPGTYQDDTTDFEKNPEKYITAQIKKVYANGKVLIQFSENIDTPKDFSQFNSKILQVKVSAGPYSKIEELGFTWECTEFGQKTMTLKLTFQNPLRISYQGKDKVNVKFLQGLLFQSSKDKKKHIPGGYLISKDITRQMDNDGFSSFLGGIGDGLQGGANAIVLGNFATNLILSSSLQYLWGMINVLQITVHMPLFNINYPPNAKFISSLLVSVCTFDFIPSEEAIINAFQFEGDEPYDSNFDALDIFQLKINLNFITLTPFHDMAAKQARKAYFYFANKLYYNYFLTFLIEGYISYALISMINIQNLKFDESLQILSSLLALVFFILTVLSPIAIAIFINKSFDYIQAEDDLYEKRYGSLWDTLKRDSRKTLFWNVLFLLKRFAFALTAVFMRESPTAQVQIVVYLNLTTMMYVLYTKPFSNPAINKLEIFNEVCVLLISYLSFLFTDYINNPKTQYKIGLFSLFVSAVMIGVNSSYMTYMMVLELSTSVKRLINKIKGWVAEKRISKYFQVTKTPDHDDDHQRIQDRHSIDFDNSSHIKNQQMFEQTSTSFKPADNVHESREASRQNAAAQRAAYDVSLGRQRKLGVGVKLGKIKEVQKLFKPISGLPVDEDLEQINIPIRKQTSISAQPSNQRQDTIHAVAGEYQYNGIQYGDY